MQRLRLDIVLAILLVLVLCQPGSADATENGQLPPLYNLPREELVAAARNYLITVGHEDWGYAVGVMPPLSRIFRDPLPEVSWSSCNSPLFRFVAPSKALKCRRHCSPA